MRKSLDLASGQLLTIFDPRRFYPVNIIQGSILNFEGDAIVNPANSFLRHGAGLAKIIADAAAPKVAVAGDPPWPGAELSKTWWAEQHSHPLIATGGAGVTSAGHLPYQGIIHAVGPIWAGGGLHERELLIAAHRSAIQRADERGWKRIAFPAISCGIFGFPVNEAASYAVSMGAVAEAVYGIECSFYLFEDAHYAAYTEAAR